MPTLEIPPAERRQILLDVARAIAAQTPSYYEGAGEVAPALEDLRREVLVGSLDGFLRVIEAGDVEIFDFAPQHELGRQECRHGRPLGDLLQVPWAASLQFWRYLAQRAAEAGDDAATVEHLSDIVMEWSGRISLALSEGYHEEMAAVTGALETRRRRLVELVLRDPPVPTGELAVAATDVGSWRLPQRLAVLVASGPGDHVVRRALPAHALAAEVDGLLIALLPHPIGTGALAELRGTLPEGTVAALGPIVELAQAHASASRARSALQLAQDGLFDPTTVVDCETRTVELVLLGDREVAADHVTRWLRPLDDTKASMRRQLEATLAAWLRHQGSAAGASNELGVHPHTISYRVARLRELFGHALDDPDQRFELELALRLRGLLERATPAAD